MEPYILATKRFETRCIFTQLRISAHDLHIETGRYTKPAKTPIENRICFLCNDNKIEDEFHFVMECLHYDEFRKELTNEFESFTLYSELQNNDMKFTYFMSGNNGDTEIFGIVTQIHR